MNQYYNLKLYYQFIQVNLPHTNLPKPSVKILMSSLDYQHSNLIFTNQLNHSIWIGDLASAQNIEQIHQHNIKTVITAVDTVNVSFPKNINIRHFKYPLKDHKSEQIVKHLDEVSNIIHKSLKLGSVLVHCAAGVSRSTTLVIAYFIDKLKMSFRDSLKLCKQKRPEVCPNLGFQLQLKAYEKQKSGSQIQSKNISRQRVVNKLELSFPDINKVQQPKIVNHHLKFKISPAKKLEMNGSTIFRRPSPAKLEKKSFSHTQYTNLTPQYLKQVARFRFGITYPQKWNF